MRKLNRGFVHSCFIMFRLRRCHISYLLCMAKQHNEVKGLMMKFHRKSRGVLAKTLAAAWLLSLTSTLSANAQSATPQRGGTAVFSLAQDPTSLSPVWDPLESTCRHASLSIL